MTIIDCFDEAFSFIQEARANGDNIFIHCQMGKSRSATIVIAYLIKYSNMSTEEAYKFLKEKRKTIFPNLGFMRQLREFEKKLKLGIEKMETGTKLNELKIEEEDFIITKK